MGSKSYENFDVLNHELRHNELGRSVRNGQSQILSHEWDE